MFWILGNITIFITFFSQITNIFTGKIFNNYVLRRSYNFALLNTKYNFINDNKNNFDLISISPGGFKGFYMLGVTSYIKKHYDLSNYIFSGASAGAWNALLMVYNGDIDLFLDNILKVQDELTSKDINLYQIEKVLKKKILTLTKDEDYDLSRLFIGVSTFHKYKFVVNIFSNFNNLEDAIDCCIASSHIPFITGGLLKKYNDMYVFDGGFTKYPYINNTQPKLHITPNIWNKSDKKIIYDISAYTTIFPKGKFDMNKLYLDGFYDSEKNKHILDNIFIPKKI